MNISEVKELNARIEQIQTQRTKVETKREMLMADLSAALESYADTYGIDLRKGTLSGTKAEIEKEKSRIESLIGVEFELKSKVVSAIESGDIATAKKLLGVAEEVEESEESEEEEAEVEESPEEETEVEEEIVDIIDSEDDYEESEESEESEEEEEGTNIGKIDEGDSDWGDLSVEDDDEVVETTGKSFLDAVAKADKKSKAKPVSDEDLDDFGFGSITKGTKFGK